MVPHIGAANVVGLQEDDKLREECGVVAVHGHPDAARQTYLGLYALAASRAGICRNRHG